VVSIEESDFWADFYTVLCVAAVQWGECMFDKPLREGRDEYEKAYFEFHLVKENGSMTRVAEKTGLERTHLYRKLKQLGVDLTRKRG
jgi:DNA-binding NtrC family response regulator